MNTIEKKALEILTNFQAEAAPIPVKSIIKKLDINLTAFDLGSDVSGVLVIENEKAKIGYNPSESNVRQRFTLAHELGHYVLHCNNFQKKLFVDGTKVMFRKQNASPTEAKQEREANTFAAALLMPQNLIEIEIERITEDNEHIGDERLISILASIFKVSQVAMTYRLIKLGFIVKY